MKATLEKRYNAIVQEYIEQFCEKQDVVFDFWVADKVGDIACFGDVLFFNFSDIVFDINTKQPKGKIIDWLNYNLEYPDEYINYVSYANGGRHVKQKS